MYKEWIWWQIEASLEHLEDDSCIPLSDLTVCFWMAVAVKRCTGLLEEKENHLNGGQLQDEAVNCLYLCCSDSLGFEGVAR